MRKFSHKINNKEGLHARPAGALLTAAKQYACEIDIVYKAKRVSLKSGVFALMALGLKYGEDISIEFTGIDENEAFDNIQKLINELL